MTPPLVPVPHNWVDRVERDDSWPTAVLSSRDGHEQAVQLALAPRTRLRYKLTTVTPETYAAVVGPVLAAATAASSETRGQLRLPRWEDMLPLDIAATSGDVTLTVAPAATDALAYRSWRDGGEIALWRPGAPVLVRTLAASAAIGTTTLTLAAALGVSVPAGTRVAPVSVVRLAQDVAWERQTGTVATATLVVDVEDELAGATPIAAGAAGRAQVPAVVWMQVRDDRNQGAGVLRGGQQLRLRARCVDAAGIAIRPALVWTSSNSANAKVRSPDPSSGIGYLDYISGSATITVTEPVSGLVSTYGVL